MAFFLKIGWLNIEITEIIKAYAKEIFDSVY